MDALCETKAAILRNDVGALQRIARNSSVNILMCLNRLSLTHASFMLGHIAERYSKLASRRGIRLMSIYSPTFMKLHFVNTVLLYLNI